MTGGSGEDPLPQVSFPGSPTLVAGGERRGRRCRHIRGLGRAEPGDAGAGRVYPSGRAGRGAAGSEGARLQVGGKLAGLEVLAALREETGPVEPNDGVQAAL